MSDRLARVLAHPLRDRILFEYQDGPACASEVAHRLGQPLNLVSYHTGVLVRHGCLELVRTERRRGALTRFYRSTVDQFIGPDEWIRLPLPLRRALVLGTLGRLAGQTRQAALSGGFDGSHAYVTRLRVELDDAGERAADRVLRRAFDEITALAEEARRRPRRRHLHEVALLAFRTDDPGERREG